MPARYIEMEKFWGNKGIVARSVDSNLLALRQEAVRHMKKLLLLRFIQWACPCPPLPDCFMFQLPLFYAGCEILRNVFMKNLNPVKSSSLSLMKCGIFSRQKKQTLALESVLS